MIDLKTLTAELGIKTPLEEIEANKIEIITNFLLAEKEHRKQEKIKRLLKASGIRKVKTFEQFDWKFNPKINKQEIMEYLNSPWIDQAYNLVMIGDTGLGKSHIANAFCYEAILKGHTAVAITAHDLISKIGKALNQTSRIDYFSKVRVLAIDELGYVYYKKQETDLLFQVIAKRTEVLPTIITTNLVPKEWGSIFSGSTASAILDRLSFNGKFLTFEGQSYRLLKKYRPK